MDEIEKYIDYLFEKLEIECDKNDIQCIKQKNLKGGKKTKSNIQLMLLQITKELITKYRCYNVIDVEKNRRLDEKDVIDLCEMYKKYKQNDKISSIVPELKMDYNLNTSDTYYIDTLDRTITTKMLVNRYGELRKTGDENSKHRYEYKFLLTYKNKKYIYCLYDYKKDGEFEKEEDINWHIGCNIDKKEVTKVFMYKLKSELGMIEEIEENE